ncbi:MAG: hypothetical protein IPK83_11415 [Planctomycetes bacterium]|nr:hypothetical protein [Planctomycetota bacterium]
MGAWGTAIFSDDLAQDIRLEFRELIGDGLSPEEATKKMVRKNKSALSEPEEAPVFWMALAATQWKCGRLIHSVKNKALAAIKDPASLILWREEGEKLVRKRQAVMAALKVQLLSPQPPPKRLSKVFHDRTDWRIGHAVSYRLLSGKYVVLRVIGLDSDAKSQTAIVDVCDWVGVKVPSANFIAKCPRKRSKWYDRNIKEAKALKGEERNCALRWEENDGKFAVYSHSKRDYPEDRLAVVAKGLKFKSEKLYGVTYFGGWRKLDKYLEVDMKLK